MRERKGKKGLGWKKCCLDVPMEDMDVGIRVIILQDLMFLILAPRVMEGMGRRGGEGTQKVYGSG